MENKSDPKLYAVVMISVAVISCLGVLGAAFINVLPDLIKPTPVLDTPTLFTTNTLITNTLSPVSTPTFLSTSTPVPVQTTLPETSISSSPEPKLSTDLTRSDEFNSPILKKMWFWKNEDPTHWNLNTNSGYLSITTQFGDIYATTNNAQNILLQTAPEENFIIITKLAISSDTHAQQAGLVVYGDDDNYIRLTRGFMYNGNRVEYIEEQDGLITSTNYIDVDAGDIYLAIKKTDGIYVGSYSLNGIEWFEIDQSVNFFDASLKIGLVAFNGLVEYADIPVFFDFFRLDIIKE